MYMGNKREEAEKKRARKSTEDDFFDKHVKGMMIHKKLCKYGDGLRFHGPSLNTGTEIYTTTLIYFFLR